MALFYTGLQETSHSVDASSLKDLPKSTTVANGPGFFYAPEIIKSTEISSFLPGMMLSEQYKGLVEKDQSLTSEDVGEMYPYNMDIEMLQGIYANVGFVTGVIDKYIDYVISPGFYFKSEDLRAQKVITDFARHINLDSVLRGWLRDGLICGNGYMELISNNKGQIGGVKVLNPKFMFVKRDPYGKILNYTQWLRTMKKQGGSINTDKVLFKPDEIAHFPYNKIGDNAYGIGMVFPALDTVNKLLKAQKDMHKILERKANAQLHVKMGDAATKVIPSPEVINQMGQKMQYMNEKTEWVTDAYVDMKILDFGDVSDKFMGIVNNDFDMLFFTFQVPEVLMGRGNIAEGLGAVQMDAFERRIKSIQSEMGRIVEHKIIKRVLDAQGFKDVDIEMCWGEMSDAKEKEQIQNYTELLKNPMLSMELKIAIEKDLLKLLGFEKESEALQVNDVEQNIEPQQSQEPDEQSSLPEQDDTNNQTQKNNLGSQLEEVYKGTLVY